MSRILVGIWSYSVAWTSSAFVHVLDADVNGVQGLWSPSVLALFAVIIAFAVLSGLLVGALGYGGGPDSSRLLAMAGFATLSGLVLLSAPKTFATEPDNAEAYWKCWTRGPNHERGQA